MPENEKAALSRQALGGPITIVSEMTLPHNRRYTKQASNAMKKLSLTGGGFALVDDQEFNRLNLMPWHLGKDGYVRNGYGKTLAAFIMHPKPKHVVDHRNRNRLDNRRQNLRVCTPGENARNRDNRRGSSGYKGVSLNADGRWWVRITVDGRTFSFGSYLNVLDAAHVYNQVAEQLHGEFACLNEIKAVS